MAGTDRDARIAAAFVKLADTLITDYDVVDLMNTLIEESIQLVASDAGGLMIADSTGTLQLLASTDEHVEFVEVNELNAGAGPCVEAFTTGAPVSVGDIAAASERWPEFAEAAAKQGFKSMHAFPMRLRGQVIGALNLFSATTGELSTSEVAVAQALADVATIGILHERSLHDSTLLSQQLQWALDSRIVVEQAKGVIAAQTGADMDAAFRAMRSYARSNRLTLRAVAASIAARTLTLTIGSRSTERPVRR